METSLPSSDRWMWPVSGVSVVLAGMRRVEHLGENLGAWKA